MTEEWRIREKERRKKKKEWTKEKEIIQKRIAKLEWMNKKKEREDRKKNNVIKRADWNSRDLEKVVEDFIKESIDIS